MPVKNVAPLGLVWVTTAQRDLITPASGDVVYNTTTKAVEQYEDGVWIQLTNRNPGLYGKADKWRTNDKPLKHIAHTGDSIVQGSAGSRSIATVGITVDSPFLTAGSSLFTVKDEGRVVVHASVPAGAVITRYVSGTLVMMDVPATATSASQTIWLLNPSMTDRLRNAIASQGIETHIGFRGPWFGDFSPLYLTTSSSQEYIHGGAWGLQGSSTIYDGTFWLQNNSSPPAARTTVQVTDAAITGTTTLTSATAAFVAADVGRLLTNSATGGAGNIAPNTYILSVTNGTTVVLSQPCTNGTALTVRFENSIMWQRAMCPARGPILAFDLITLDCNVSNANFSYSLDGGVTWVNVPQATTAATVSNLRSTRVTATIADTGTIVMRGANAAGTHQRFIPMGIIFYSTTAPKGVVVSDIAMAGGTLETFAHSYTITDAVVTNASPTVTSAMANFQGWQVRQPITGPGIPAATFIGIVNSATSIGLSSSAVANTPVNATATTNPARVIVGSAKNGLGVLGNYDNVAAAWQGMKCDLLIAGPFSNDLPGRSDMERYRVMLERLASEVRQWGGDVLYVGAYEQAEVLPARSANDVTTNGTTTIVSATLNFNAGNDVGAVIMGDNIPTGGNVAPTITAVTNATTATISQTASGSKTNGFLSIDRSIAGQKLFRGKAKQAAENVGAPYIDLYEVYGKVAGALGWTAADAAGLQQDQYHPTAKGNIEVGMRLFRALQVAG